MELKIVRVVLTVVILVQLFNLCESLKKGDKGVCEKRIPSRSRVKPRAKLYCCPHYEYEDKSDKCLPVCQLGCINGTCVDVDTCACQPPLILVNNVCVPPTCDDCQHGECVAPNDCRCHKGYIKNTNGTCIPNCDYVCVNGKCSEPNKCECDSGYKIDPDNKFVCNPICDPECVNGHCIAHNKCLCNLGYESTGISSVCKPKCDGCDYGQCVAPNNCACFEGYELVNSTCQPECSACSHGDCVAPEECRCHKGYQLTKESCAPICSPPCTNGQCTEPGKCSCDEGYQLTDAGCQPVCTIPCVNGDCSAPNSCSCKEGYLKNDTDHSLCYKPCHPPCFNGTCDLHGNCNCFMDFLFDNKTKTCTAIEPIECSACNGSCLEDSKECRCANETLCFYPEFPPEVAPSTKMAGLDLTLISIGSSCLLLVILIVVVMQRIWHKRKAYGNKPASNDGSGVGSVVYTVPHTLIKPKSSEEFEDHPEEGSGDEEATTDTLLRRETYQL